MLPDFFFEMNDDNEFLSKLCDSQIFTVWNVFICLYLDTKISLIPKLVVLTSMKGVLYTVKSKRFKQRLVFRL